MRLVLSGYGYYIGKKSGMIVIKKDGDRKMYSVGNISELVVHSRGIHFSGEALALLMKHGVKVYFIDKLRIRGKLTPFKKGSTIFIVKHQLKNQGSPRGNYLAKRFIEGKVYNQISFLRLLRRRFRRKKDVVTSLSTKIELLKNVIGEIGEIDLSSNMFREQIISKEGEASRIYWDALSSLLPEEYGFKRRMKRFDKPKDPINISLNYLYTLLASQVWIETELCGLEPYIGLLHKDSTRRPALVMDMMEEFRVSIVDKPLFTYVFKHTKKPMSWLENDGKLTRKAVETLGGLFFKRIDESVTFLNRSYKLKTHIGLQCRRLIKYLMGYSDEYIPFKLTK